MNAQRLTHLSIACALTLAASLAQAQVTIDQNKALAGSVTAGDSAGFPITISQSGSYKLTGNLVVPAGVRGIVVSAPNVTLDMNGFSLTGPSTCTRDASTRTVACTYSDGLTHGIDASAGAGTVVRNGTVKGFAGAGIYAGAMDRYEALHVTQNTGGLTDATAFGLSISSSIIDLNAANGITMGRGLISSCRVAMNGANGVSGTTSAAVTESVVASNRMAGLLFVVARGTLLDANGTNRSGVVSMGGNLDNVTAF